MPQDLLLTPQLDNQRTVLLPLGLATPSQRTSGGARRRRGGNLRYLSYPRQEHFAFQGALIVGLTPVGRAEVVS
jgi:hypothetical protein